MEFSLDVKWVEKQNFHITVRFLGDTETAMIQRLVTAVEERLGSLRPFTVFLRGIGAFPSVRKPRILWVGIDAFEPLVLLHRLVEDALVNLGFPPDNKRFTPHITIGRFRSARNAAVLEKKIGEIGNQEFGEVKVEELKLFASQLYPTGPVYTPISTVTFPGDSG